MHSGRNIPDFRRVRMRKNHLGRRLRKTSGAEAPQDMLCDSRRRFPKRFHGTGGQGRLFCQRTGRGQDPLGFNWDCITATADRAFQRNLDVVIDYVTEDELPRVRELAEKHHAALYYIVLTAEAEEIGRRLRNRGDTDLTERALFLKNKLEAMPENRGHLYDNTGKTPEDMIREIVPEQYLAARGKTDET